MDRRGGWRRERERGRTELAGSGRRHERVRDHLRSSGAGGGHGRTEDDGHKLS